MRMTSDEVVFAQQAGFFLNLKASIMSDLSEREAGLTRLKTQYEWLIFSLLLASSVLPIYCMQHYKH